MIQPITEEDRRKYREDGYHVIPQVIPASLLKDLRREAAKAQEIARRISGPQAQRISVLGNYSEELELRCLNYCQAMPGAVQLVLNPGDFCIYRNTGWHIGNYVPYRKRMTIHTQCDTQEFGVFRKQYFHLLNARAASLEKHRNLQA